MQVTPSDANPLLLLVNKGLPGVTLYDTGANQPIWEARTGISPHEAAFSSDGQHVFVPIYGNSGVGKPGTDEHTIHVFRTGDGSPVGELDTGECQRPHGIAAGDSGRMYVTAEIAEALLVLDGAPQPKIICAIPTGSNTSHMFALTRDERRAYVSNVRSKNISVLDIVNRKLLAMIPTEGENQRMTLSPDEQWFVTSLGPAGKIAFYRTSDHQLDFTVPVDGIPFVAKFSLDGRFLYNFGFAGDQQAGAWKIDVADRRVAASLTSGLGEDPGSIEVNPFSADVYISDQPGNRVLILDSAGWKVKHSFATSRTPDAMAFFPRKN